MPKFVMLVGLPGSGKSTIAPLIAVKEQAVVYSSDKMRLELFGDEAHQDDNGLVFDELYRRARQTLEDGRSVVIDATNISSKRRIGVMKQFERYLRDVYYFATPFEVCRKRNAARDRVVPEAALAKMYRSLQIPSLEEGWDEIHLLHEEPLGETVAAPFAQEQLPSHDRLFGELRELSGYFERVADRSSRSYDRLKHLFATYEGEDREQMLWAAVLHDLGKGVCQKGYQRVSAQMTMEILRKAGYDDLFLYEVAQIVVGMVD